MPTVLPTHRGVVRLTALALALALAPTPIRAQQPADTTVRGDSLRTRPFVLEEIAVTATRSPRRVFAIPQAVSVVDRVMLHRRPMTSPVEVLPMLPGTDLTGVGPNQLRPAIRGQRGQRILLLEDGLRLNNSRRQQDFGELPALVGFNTVDRVEVVRGPSSVLYGSDAIGGVVNLIGAGLPWGTEGRLLQGAARLRYAGGTAGGTEPGLSISGREGRVAFGADASFRSHDAYRAPAGTFGSVALADDVPVLGTGVDDRNLGLRLGVALSDAHRVFARVTSYAAEDAGFGFVDPAEFGPYAPRIDIRYPDQRVGRFTAGYLGRGLGLPLADRLEATVYRQDNERQFDQDIFIPFGGELPPTTGVAVQTFNYTDVETWGGRLEASRLVAGRHNLTYGVDYTRDATVNRDSSVSTVVGFGPPMPEVNNTPNVPHATYRMLGAFGQGELALSRRVTLILGARYQANRAETEPTPGLDDPLVASTDDALVGAANALFALSDEVNLVAALGRGFRSPNVIERFFNGVTPEGSGFQQRNTDLEPETSVNLDLGVRIRRPAWVLEAFVFRNEITDGIRVAATGDTVDGFPVFRNVNVDRLRVQGLELAGEVVVAGRVTLGGSFTLLDQENVDETLTPVGDTYANKLTAEMRYRQPGGRFWGGIRLRHHGEQDDIALGMSPVGNRLPSFTLVSLDAGARLFDLGRTRHTLTATVDNVGDQLYAEASNAGFFRPGPGRRLLLAWSSEF